ncbi:McrB family protein, partial [Okeania sp. SIO2C2]|uniref:McrB family protein n=1 Tax=Okeania sp. SIO2C2 TaxID=2607787 RepID=UPI0025800947
MPNQITKWLDMNCEMFAYPGWNLYYEGILCCKDASMKNPQLFICISDDSLFFGLIIFRGSYYKKIFLENLQKYPEVKDFVLKNKLDSRCQLHGKKKRRSSYSLSSWLKNPAGKNTTHKSIQSSVHLSIETVLHSSTEELTNRIFQTFKTIFPLFLIAICDEPMSAIKEYMNPYNQLCLSLNYQPTLLTNKTNKIKLKSIYTLSQCAQETNITEIQITQWIRAINRKKQAIFQGPSGTGKTFISQKLAQHLIAGGDGFWELIQFHPAYTYEDFIQGIRPQSEDGKLTYPVVPGRFLKFCQKAALCQDTCVLIIDEINRANLSQVFGELMYLLEYRDAKIPLANSGE